MVKPYRQFNANEGDYSVGLAGPDAIENDIDGIIKMFDPESLHEGGLQGGISTENIQDNVITDDKIGNRTINQGITTSYGNTNKLTTLLSFIAKTIRGLKGTANWYDTPSDTINNIHARVNTNLTNINALTTSKADKTYVDAELGKKVNTTTYDSGISGLQTQITNTSNGLGTINSNISNLNSDLQSHKVSNHHDSRYYTKQEIAPYITGGDSIPKEEVFTIVNKDNGNNTFTYNNGTQDIIGPITAQGHRVFTLTQGQYTINSNHLTVWIDDALRRTSKSGGIEELSTTTFSLKEDVSNGMEISAEYNHRVGLLGEYNIIINSIKPPSLENAIWFEVVEEVNI